LRASGSSILPKHPLKALWNSPLNSVQNTDLEPPIYRLQETLKTAENRTLSVDRPNGSLPHPDRFLRYPSETTHILSLSGVRPVGLTERPDGLHWNPFHVRTKFWSYLNCCISSGRLADNEHHLDVMPSCPNRILILPNQCRFLRTDFL